MSKYALKDVAEVVLVNKRTEEVIYRGEMKTLDIEWKPFNRKDN